MAVVSCVEELDCDADCELLGDPVPLPVLDWLLDWDCDAVWELLADEDCVSLFDCDAEGVCVRLGVRL